MALGAALLAACSRMSDAPPLPATREEVVLLRQMVLDAKLAVERGDTADVRAAWAARRDTDPRRRDAVRLGLATLERFAYQLPAAMRDLADVQQHGTEAARLYATLALGELATARFDSAGLPLMKTAFTRAAVIHDSTAMAEALMYRARLEVRLGSRDSAFALYEQAARIAPTYEPQLRGKLACFRGFAERDRDPTRALALIAEGMALADSGPLRRIRGFCHLARAQTLHWMGEQTQAAAQLDSGIPILRASHDADVEAGSWQLLGYLHADYLGPLRLARLASDSAAAIGRRCGNRLAAGWAQLVLARIAMRLGETEEAWRVSREAARDLGAIGDRLGLANVVLVSAESAHLEGRLDIAEARYTQLDTMFDRGLMAQRTLVWLRLAALARTRGALVRADSLLQIVDTAVANHGLDGFGQDRQYERALLHAKAGDWTRAATLLAAFERASNTYPDMQFAALSRQAQVAAAAGRMDDALLYLDRADAVLRRRRNAIVDRSERLLIARSQRIDFDPDIGMPVLVSLLARGGRPDDALYAAEVNRARESLSRLERSIANVGRDDAVGRRSVQAISAAQDRRALRQLVPEHAVVLEYVIGDAGEPSTLLVIRRDSVVPISLTIPDDLADQVMRFTTALAADAPAVALGRTLAESVVSAALPILDSGVTRLYVVPDGALHRLPFEALVLRDGRRLLQAYDIEILPSIRLLARATPPPTRSRAPRIVAFGDAIYSATSGLPPLPASGVEASRVAALDTGGILRLGRDASEAQLKVQAQRGVNILHLATHTTVSDARISGSVMHLSAADNEDGEVTVGEIARLDLDADLVVLSACRTAGGIVLRGEGLQGMTAPFLQAGARNVLATRWTVRDRELLPLMAAIYARLAAGSTVGDAVHEARVASIMRGEGPRQWASLMLVGDARSTPLLRAINGSSGRGNVSAQP